METVQFNYPAILVAALISFVVGGAWYSPLLFAKAWMKEAGLDDAALKRAKLGKVFALAFLCSLVMAFNLSAFLGAKATLAFGTAGRAWPPDSAGWRCRSASSTCSSRDR